MPLPNPLPPRFTAGLAVTVRADIAHPILKGGRQSVAAPAEGRLDATVRVDRQAGTLGVVAFPAVADRVETKLGRVRAEVVMRGLPAGTFDSPTGHAAFETTLDVRPDHFLARDSVVALTLSTDDRVEAGDDSVEGDPLDDGDDAVRLVGEGRFRGGTLDGGQITLVLDARVVSVEERV